MQHETLYPTVSLDAQNPNKTVKLCDVTVTL